MNDNNSKKENEAMEKRMGIATAILMVMVMCFSVAAFAETDVEVIKGVTVDYFGATPEVQLDSGHHYWITGPGGRQRIAFSSTLIGNIKKLRANPDAGQSLMTICPTQARLLRLAMKSLAPLDEAEMALPCQGNDGCYGPGGSNGKYDTWKPYKEIRVVNNSGNSRYPANAITFKAEYHKAGHRGWPYGTGWGPTIVFRNIAMDDPYSLITEDVVCYLNRIWELKKGQSGEEGESCYEIGILRNGVVFKNESPTEVPY